MLYHRKVGWFVYKYLPGNGRLQALQAVPKTKFSCALFSTTKCRSVFYNSQLFTLRGEKRHLLERREKNHLPPGDIKFRQSSQATFYTFPLIVGMQDLLVNVQEISGLPWWATIISATVMFRLMITLPLARKQAETLAKVELLQPTINEVVEALKHNIAIKGKRDGKPLEDVNREFRMEARLHTRDMYKREKCNPIKLYFLPWVQLPLWIIISLALRNLSGFLPRDPNLGEATLAHAGLLTGGFGWVTDLSVSDPYLALPAIIGVTNLLNIELNTLKKTMPSRRQIIVTRVFRSLTIAMVFFSAQVPAAMSLYWATSSSYGLIQNLTLMQPAVRRTMRIPQAPSESATPLQDKVNIFKTKLDLFMKIQRK